MLYVVCTAMARQSNAGIGGAIREARLASGLSPEGLAFKAGVSLSTVERIERGAVQPRRATLAVLALALGVEPGEFAQTREAA